MDAFMASKACSSETGMGTQVIVMSPWPIVGVRVLLAVPPRQVSFTIASTSVMDWGKGLSTTIYIDRLRVLADLEGA